MKGASKIGIHREVTNIKREKKRRLPTLKMPALPT